MRPRLPIAILALAVSGALHAQVPPPVDAPYAPGPLTLAVDASNIAQRIIRIDQTIPATPGRLTLLYPEWLPGNHAPRGPIDKLAGIIFTAGGRKLAWTRDPLNVYAFHVDVPQGVSSIRAQFQFLTPTEGTQGRVVMTPAMLNLQWVNVLLYPAGHASWRIDVKPQVTYPTGWQAATALEVESRQGNTVVYKPVNLEILGDSPVFAGKHFRQFDLAPGAKVPVRLNVVADDPKALDAKPEHIAQHRALVTQALKLFGAQHYDHYDFLLALTNQLSGIGLEHQRSSENSQNTGYFSEWDPKKGVDDLLPHEYVHSWDGKYRRPQGQNVPNYNVPLDNRLLWVYEGQTMYWGPVLAARSGLAPMDVSRDEVAMLVASYTDNRPGLQQWRTVEDTTLDPIIAARRPKSFPSWQSSEDYYAAGQMIWFGVDGLIRSKTGGRKSLDDFARAFYGVNDGDWRRPHFYTLEDLAQALNGVLPMDWAGYLRDRVEGRVPFHANVEALGWKLVYKDTPTAAWKSANSGGTANETYSIGMNVAKDGRVRDVRWDGPAFNAGIGSGQLIVAVNDVEFGKDALADAIKAAKEGGGPIRLLLKDFNRYRTVNIDYRGGLRYPHLERIPGTPDLLTDIFTARK